MVLLNVMSGLIPQNRWLTVHESQASAPAPARESHTRATSPAAASLRRYVLLGAPRPAPSACVRARSPSRAHCLSSASISQGKFSDVVGPSVKVSERYPWELCYANKLVLWKSIKIQEVPCQQTETETRAVPFRSLSASDILWQAGRQGPGTNRSRSTTNAALIGFLSIGGLFPETGGETREEGKKKRIYDRAQ